MSSSRAPWLWACLAAALVVEIVVFALGQGDFTPSDPLWYAANAHTLAVAPDQLIVAGANHPFVMRVGLIGPLSVLYQVFGVTPLVTSLPCLVAVLTITVVVFLVAPTPRAKLIGLVACVGCKALIVQGSILDVDLPCAAVMAVSIYCLWRRDGGRGRAWLVAAAVTWFCAFLVKETAVWCLPVWIYAAVYDARRADGGWRAVARAYAPALVVGGVLAIAYLGVCAWLWGDALARFKGIQQLQHTWAMEGKGASAWVSRLVWRVPQLAWRELSVVAVLAVLAGAFVRGKDRLWIIAFWVMLLMYWFGSASVTSYTPLPLVPRMFMPVVPFALVATVLGVEAGLDHVADVKWRRGIAGVIVGALVLQGVANIRWWLRRPAPEQHAFAVLHDLADRDAAPFVIVCADSRSRALATFYFGFDFPPRITILAAADYAAQPPPAGARVVAFVNRTRVGVTDAIDPRGDRGKQIEALKLPVLLSDGPVRLYDAGDGGALRAGL